MTIQIGVDDENRIMLAQQYAGDPRPSFAFVKNDGGECCCPPPPMPCGNCQSSDVRDLMLGSRFTVNGSNVATAIDFGTPAHETIEFLPRFADWQCSDRFVGASSTLARAFTATEIDLIGDEPWPMTYDPVIGGPAHTVAGYDHAPGRPSVEYYSLAGVTTRPRWTYTETIASVVGDWSYWNGSAFVADTVTITKTATMWLGAAAVTHPLGDYVVHVPNRTPLTLIDHPNLDASTVTCDRNDPCNGGANSNPRHTLWATLRIEPTSGAYRPYAYLGMLVQIACGFTGGAGEQWTPQVNYFPYTVRNTWTGREWTYLKGL